MNDREAKTFALKLLNLVKTYESKEDDLKISTAKNYPCFENILKAWRFDVLLNSRNRWSDTSMKQSSSKNILVFYNEEESGETLGFEFDNKKGLNEENVLSFVSSYLLKLLKK